MTATSRIVTVLVCACIALALLPMAPAQAAPVVRVRVSPSSDNINTTARVVATVTDGGVAVPGTIIRFSILSGPNVGDPLGSCTTAENGQCRVEYVGDEGPGTDAIAGFIDQNNNGARDEGEPGGVAERQWVNVPPGTCLDIEPEVVTAEAKNEYVVTITVTDQIGTANDDTCEGQPVPGVWVTVSLRDAATDTFISSLNGEAVQSNFGFVAASAEGRVDVGLSVVDKTALGSDPVVVLTRVSGQTEDEGERDISPLSDSMGITWVDTIPPTISSLKASPRTITPNGDRNKDKTTISFSTDETSDVTVVVRRRGKLVRNLLQGRVEPGNVSTLWNAKNKNGKKVKSGEYKIKVTAIDVFGNASTASTTVTVKR